MLTLDRLRREGIEPVGIIANHLAAKSGIAEDTFIEQLTEFDPVTVLGELPFLKHLPSELNYWEKLTPHIDLEKLLALITSDN